MARLASSRLFLGRGELNVDDEQFGGAERDDFFQMLAMLPQLLVAGLNLRQHLVEAIYQQSQFVLAMFGGAERIILFGGDDFRRLRQMQDRLGDHALEFGGEQIRGEQRRQHDHGNDPGVTLQAVGNLAQV